MARSRYGIRSKFRCLSALLLFVFAATQVGCGNSTRDQRVPDLQLKSASFSGQSIQDQCSSCNGQGNRSPELSWNAPPSHVLSFALIVFDKDSLFGLKFVHWVIYNLPAETRELPLGIKPQAQLPDGSRQGRNGFDKVGYGGPCPPGHSAHHYVFTLYALDTRLDLPVEASRKQVENGIAGHILAKGELVGTYQH